MGSNPTPSAMFHKTSLTDGRDIDGHLRSGSSIRLGTMKAILQATLAAIVSGILVGVLLKKKVSGATRTP